MRLSRFLEMDDAAPLMPHEMLVQTEQVEKYTDDTPGKLIFVSHEWLGFDHPDPMGQQMTHLRTTLECLSTGHWPLIESDLASQQFLDFNVSCDANSLSHT